MKPRARIPADDLLADDSGTTLVEFAIVLPIFLLLFLGTIDFGRFGAEYMMAQKAMQLAARTAAVRPAACAGVPTVNLRGATPAGTTPPRFGTVCSAAATVCVNPGTISCAGNVSNPTVAEIWGAVSPILPNGATPANLLFRYDYDPDLGFLGGPYVPIVTVEIQNLNFQFATPLGALALVAGSGPTSLGAAIPFPPMSNSLPAEDLAQGEAG